MNIIFNSMIYTKKKDNGDFKKGERCLGQIYVKVVKIIVLESKKIKMKTF